MDLKGAAKEKLELFERAMAGDCDAMIERGYLFGMYAGKHVEDYYRTKKWCEENEVAGEE